MLNRRSADPDVRLLRRAARTVAVQTAAAVAAVVLTMAAAVLLVNEHEQHRQADRISRSTWASADDVGDPPAETWLVVRSPAGRRQVTPGAPAALAGVDPSALPDGHSHLDRDGREFVIFTGNRKNLGRVSAVFGLSSTELEERRLQLSLAVAALFGVLGAGLVGALIGRRAVRPLGQALALQRRFVADASHELRTPLSVLLLRAQLLRRHLDQQVTPERTAELDRLVHDTQVLGEVVNDMLLSAELEHSPHSGERVDLAALAVDVTESLQPLAGRRSVDLEVAADAGTDPESLQVSGAAPSLRRAIAALIDNAIAHAPAGGHVRVRLRREAARVLLAVVDDGEGLDPQQADRLVERFSRGTSAGSGRRFGLGLALVDEVARAHGGTLMVDGEPGAGAIFTLSLPVAP